MIAAWLLHPSHSPQLTLASSASESASKHRQNLASSLPLKHALDNYGAKHELAASLQKIIGSCFNLWLTDMYPEALALFLAEWGAKEIGHDQLLRWALCLDSCTVDDRSRDCGSSSSSSSSSSNCSTLFQLPSYQRAAAAALLAATTSGDLHKIRLIIKCAKADCHVEHDRALRWASAAGREDVCALLLEEGADPHALGDQALTSATLFGHRGVVQLLKSYMSA